MELFRIPIELYVEDRKTVQAGYSGGVCRIKFPRALLNRRKSLLITVDQVFWRLMGRCALPELTRRTDELNRRFFGFELRALRIHRQFRRWGSCSALKNINLSHRLIGAPLPIQEYVILHELAHLKHLNHGRDFWLLVKSTGQNPAARRKEMIDYDREWHANYRRWYESLWRLVQAYKPEKPAKLKKPEKSVKRDLRKNVIPSPTSPITPHKTQLKLF